MSNEERIKCPDYMLANACESDDDNEENNFCDVDRTEEFLSRLQSQATSSAYVMLRETGRVGLLEVPKKL